MTKPRKALFAAAFTQHSVLSPQHSSSPMILYLDPFMGIAGDMTVSALVDAGAEPRAVNAAVGSLGLPGLAFTFEKVRRQGVQATFGRVLWDGPNPHRGLPDILKIIGGAPLDAAVRDAAARVFTRLAEAEAEVHGCPVEKVHFHEVGAADAIADIVGACAAWASLGGPAVECGPLNLGSGFTEMEHGTFPVPPPAVAQLVRGFPVFAFGPPTERTTPTGAALATTLARAFGPLPRGTVKSVGYGAGTKDTQGAPNVLRAMLLCEEPAEGLIAVVEAQVDDMSPELLAGALDVLRSQGARDVFLTPVQTKKGRAAWTVTALCGAGEETRFADLLLEHTTTTGARFSRCERRELARELITVQTPYGPLRVKRVTTPSGHLRMHPEWEDVKAMSEGAGVPAHQLLQELAPLLLS
jgi:pyridinium-3,5-bisthiocarboxylic acid mononucleotide nickel chelatase